MIDQYKLTPPLASPLHTSHLRFVLCALLSNCCVVATFSKRRVLSGARRVSSREHNSIVFLRQYCGRFSFELVSLLRCLKWAQNFGHSQTTECTCGPSGRFSKA